MKVYALLSFPDYGYNHDQERVKSLKEGHFYEVDRIDMGQSHTSVYLKDIKGSFNSVNFTFYNEDKQGIDIYRMPEFNPYLRREG